MGYIIGRGRNARETYSSPPNAATGAMRNRNVAAVPIELAVPFQSPTLPTLNLIAALIYTPKISGVVQVTALISVLNGAAPETYELTVEIDNGTGLSVTGGEATSNGWVVGSNTPPVIVGGTGIAQVIGKSANSLAIGARGDLAVAAAVSQPLSIGVPVSIGVLIGEVSGGIPLEQLTITSLSIIELP